MKQIPDSNEYYDESGETLEGPWNMYPDAATEILRKKVNELVRQINRLEILLGAERL